MGFVHCCGALRRARTFVLEPQEGFIITHMHILESCPVCGHKVLNVVRVDAFNSVSSFRKINSKAQKLFEKLKNSILYEENKHKFSVISGSNFYLNYNEYGKKKKCYSNLSSLKLGLFDNSKGLEFMNKAGMA